MDRMSSISPGGHTATVQSLQLYGKGTPEGSQSGVVVLVLDASIDLRRGLVISDSRSPVTYYRSFTAELCSGISPR